MFRHITRVTVTMTLTVMLLMVACQAQANDSPTNEVAPISLPTPSPDQILVLGDISRDPAGTIEAFQPVADYLAARLADFDIKQGRVIVAPDMPTMIDRLKAGEVHLFFDSPFPALTAYEEADARPLLRRWKKGVAEYHTVIVVRKDSGITDLEGLLGQNVAFEDRSSTSGYLLPKGYLTRLGLNVTEVSPGSTDLPANAISYVFAGGEENVRAWLLNGKVTGAVIPSGDFEDLAYEVKNQLQVLDRTTSIPRHIVLAHPGMEEALQARIVDLLLSMDQTPEGQAALDAFQRTKKFDVFQQGPEEAMEELRELFGEVN